MKIHVFLCQKQKHISKYIRAWQLHFLGMLTGQEVEKQIEGWKKRTTWSPHKDPDPIWEDIVFPKQKENIVVLLKKIFICPRFQGCSLCGRGKSVNYSGVISRALVLPQRYFT